MPLRLPGTEPFLSGEEDGVLYTSLEEVTERLLELMEDSERRRKLGENAASAVQQKYDWRRVAQQMIDIIHELT